MLADVIANNYVEDVKPHAFNSATSVMAGVIAWWQMAWPLQGDLYVADVIAMGHDVILILVLRC